ncbi:sulfatase [Amycolatopsis sp. NPDC051903]|uniref:sulfatase n=1 Tax=Amycolatopsis sp. NPDC051903 TaxID=3363936 RepID=UPI0037B6DFDB
MSAPNILLIFCDQLRADALRAYGNPIGRTPVLDDLAAGAAVFDCAYTPSPVCVPARAALLTGAEPQTNACFDNGDPMPAKPTFVAQLTDAGYRTHGVGKMHFTPDPQDLRGFETRDRGEEFGTARDDDYLAFLAAAGYGYVERPHGLRDEMYYVPQLSPVPEHLHFSHWVADRSIAFLDSAPKDRPFFLWSSFIAPHPPFAPPSPWHRLYEPSLMPDPFEPAGGAGLLTSYDRLQARYKYRDGGRDRRLWQLIRAYYLASVSFLDYQVGRILAALERSGQRDNTVVALTADHGEFLGDYGTFGKRSFLDPAARVPLLVSGPGFTAGRRPDPASLVDVAPTFLRAAGADPSTADGLPLQEHHDGRTVYGQFQHGPRGLYAVIGERWKYIWSAPDAREYLVDRRSDPRETQNLAYHVRVADVLRANRDQARAHFTDLADADFAAASGNAGLDLETSAADAGLAALRAVSLDRDASTLVVRPGGWPEAPPGYRPEG